MTESQVEHPHEPERSDVGYGRPPTDHRFQKGKSGNPKGRPKRARKAQSANADLLNPLLQIVHNEVYREVTVRDGDKMHKMPVIQAIARTLSVAAMKGNRLAARELINLLKPIEEDNAVAHWKAFQAVLDYKMRMTEQVTEYERQGKAPPEMIPHPEDISIDPRAGTYSIDGPMTEEELNALRDVIQFRDCLLEECDAIYHDLSEDPDSPILKNAATVARTRFKRINDKLPKRYQKAGPK